MMKKLVQVGIALALLSCTGSDSTAPVDGGPDVGKDAPIKPDLGANDSPDAHAHDLVGLTDAAQGPSADAPAGPTQPDARGAEEPIDSSNLDAPGVDANRGEVRPDDARADGYPGPDSADLCTCAEGSGASIVPWSCFCSVESCARTLGDFVEVGDGGKALRRGQGTVVAIEYAGCNLVLVQAHTYSDYVSASQYVFDRTTGALVGAKVWLDDRQHACPFSSSAARWVFGYESGGYPVPTSCQATGCLAGTGSCPGAVDAR